MYSGEPRQGPQVIRPWNLAWRADFGLSSFIEPEELTLLAELYLMEGFLAVSYTHLTLPTKLEV